MIHNSSLPFRIDNRGWTEIKVNIKIFHNKWEKNSKEDLKCIVQLQLN